MSLSEKLTEDMKQAMKAKDRKKLSVIRMVRASLQNEAIKLGVDTLSEEDELTILSRELKQRKDSIEEFEKADRSDLVDNLNSEIEILEVYMPKQLTDEELDQLIDQTIEEVNATSKRDFGKLMGALMPKVKGKADGSKVQQLVKEKLV
ncbi:MAG TPA: GatB/YqeY domain-containing protein [Pseudogracilibacillus sp.]|nr:GatB/YqeY domain-containing protein [Pseudogracilibacillus sp.]